MARLILTSPGEDVDVGGDVQVIGTRSGGEVITLLRGTITLDASFNAGGDTIVLPEDSGDYDVRLNGSQAVIQGTGLSVTIPVGTAGAQIQFGDVSLELAFDTASGTVRLGDQIVTSTLQPVEPQQGPAVTPLIAETSAANGTASSAQTIDRDALRVAPNPLLDDDDLESATIAGSISSNADKDFFEIEIEEGELLVLDIDGAAAGLDAFVRVFGPDGEELTSGDDAPLDPGSGVHPNSLEMTLDSFVTFRAPTAGTYTFSVESFEQGSSGAYQLHVSVGEPVSIAEIMAEDIDNLWGGRRWNDNDLTYGFPSGASQYGSESSDETSNNFEAFNAVQRAAATQILSMIGAVSGLSFTESTANPGSADLRYAMSDEPGTAYANYPSSFSAAGGDSWYNNSGGKYDNPTPGNYAWTTIIHETGHAVGLKHPHDAPALWFDSLEYTVMSYRSYEGAPVGDDGGYTNETWGFPTTLMMYDIAALQNIYGADYSLNSGDSTYTWSASTGRMSVNGTGGLTPGENRVFMTVWDGGGEDTYDLSNYSGGVTIDLRPGEWTTTSEVQIAYLGAGHEARGNIANALLFEGDERSLIENAIGGSGADRLVANQTANALSGRGGADTFVWYDEGDSALGEADTILDFARGSDKIDLRQIDANAGLAGDQAFQFIGTAAFGEQAGQLRYQVSGGTLHLQADTDGDGAADLEILLSGLSAVGSSDIYA